VIKVTKMGGDRIAINARLIESVQSTPDTVITLTTGKKILVTDSVDEIISKVIDYQQRVYSSLRIEKG